MTDLMYRHNILDHYQNPRHFGVLKNATHIAKVSNPLCGDNLSLFVIVDKNGRVLDISFEGEGCAISQASASMLVEKIMKDGATMKSIGALTSDDVYGILRIPISPARERCAFLILEAVERIVNYS